MTMNEMGARAKTAARALANAGPLKETALLRAAQALWERREELLAANAQDMEAGKERGMSRALLDRLALTEARVQSMARAVEEVAQAADPVGRVLSGETRPNGLRIEKVTVPLGVIGIIYEARPNVTSDAAALCLKAGNAVILRGGKEAFRSNQAVANVLRNALEEAGLPADCVQLVEDTSRQSAQELMALTDYLDVLIPRGGAGLIRSVKENARVPVIETGVGNCHVYVDRAADLDMAAEIIYNAKTSRPSVCNAIETKYLDYILAVKVVASLEEALEHIHRYSTRHSECIVTEDYTAAQRFLNEVDSAAVYVNASTRFTDGGEFGLGAEIGISTQKLHARGPMGLGQLVSYKFLIRGSGQVR